MPRNGTTGAYTRAVTPPVNGDVADADLFNDEMDDVAAEITKSMARNGESLPTANLPMGGFKFTGLTAGSANGDSVRYEQVSPLFRPSATVLSATILSGFLYGLGMQNNASDATNDIDIAAGICLDSTNAKLMPLASALTKQLDAAWAVGTGNGGLDTGSIANGTYHVWLIMRSDTGVVDVLFSTSATSPTMPSNYDYKRRIGSIMRAGGAIRLFKQDGDVFLHNDASAGGILDRNANTTGTSAVSVTLSVPTGIVTDAIINLTQNATGGTVSCSATSLDTPDLVPSASVGLLGVAITPNIGSVQGRVRTNTSAQIRTRANASGATITQQIGTIGWIDTRGRLA